MLFTDKRSASDGTGLGINKYPKSWGKDTLFSQQEEITYFATKKSGRAHETWTEPKGLFFFCL